VRHLDDARFASLRALRQLLRALDAERSIGFLSPDGSSLQEELAWARAGRCGESERVMSCAAFAKEIGLAGVDEDALSIAIDALAGLAHALRPVVAGARLRWCERGGCRCWQPSCGAASSA
jgi:hypothetical protein